MTKNLTRASDYRWTLGADPEFFFKVNKRVVGSEFFLLKESEKAAVPSMKNFFIDGVQAEVHPYANGCREGVANYLGSNFMSLKTHLKNKNVKVCFDRTVTISKEELAKLSPENQLLGCMPSFNAYEIESPLVGLDPLTYRKRSAGGHIHMGFDDPWKKKMLEDPKRFIEFFDIVCGNTCVMVDRAVGNRTRRKHYGRAGEFRLPAHGIEYRTLSNFWLHSYQLMSMAFGLARFAANIAFHPDADEYYKAFTEAVPMKDIIKAINENDYKLARKNFEALWPIMSNAVYVGNAGACPLDESVVKEFLFFVDKIQEGGLKYWFPEDPLEKWTAGQRGYGFYNYLQAVVHPLMTASKPATKK